MTDSPAQRPGLLYRLFLNWLKRAAGGRDGLPLPERLTPETLAALRRMTGIPSFPQRFSSLQIRAWRPVMLPCGSGATDCDNRPARLYRPRGAVRGLVLFLHGGGFVHCDLVSHHGICCRLARHSGAMVLSLDYRLAPEHPFPAAVDDGWDALLWLHEQARLLDLPIAVCGDSAGGNLAAVLARRAGAAGLERVVAQLLYYPTVSGLLSPVTRETYAQGYMLTARLLDWYGRQYIRSDRDMLNPDFAPVFASDLAQAPPAMIVTAGFDPLRGEGELYARLLREAGVTTRLVCYWRAIHGFLNFYAAVVEGRQALRVGGRYLRERFAAWQEDRIS
ncbi:alpha/beta hydrolase [Asaia sp. W19]|uniref:alpha/beta hydrolase n=1 Tax=unclassified Asaia TaxID=2685023 RepID=UPI000F8EBA69|nr:alpha/beta hydrolase [Asaia sp. W19]RUT25104.1 alpha/beta hydrolase [Asaia sp. W19]